MPIRNGRGMLDVCLILGGNSWSGSPQARIDYGSYGEDSIDRILTINGLSEGEARRDAAMFGWKGKHKALGNAIDGAVIGTGVVRRESLAGRSSGVSSARLYGLCVAALPLSILGYRCGCRQEDGET